MIDVIIYFYNRMMTVVDLLKYTNNVSGVLKISSKYIRLILNEELIVNKILNY